MKNTNSFKPRNSFRWISLIPSIMGLFLFVMPICHHGMIMVPIAFIVRVTGALLRDILPVIITTIICLSAVLSLITKCFVQDYKSKSYFLNCILKPALPEFIVRQLGAIGILMIYCEMGPDVLHDEATGGLFLNEILPIIFLSFLVAGMVMPLLLNFGLPEFIGTLFSRFMRPIFVLPNNAAINCIASWIGDGSVGILITNKLFEMGIYTRREAAVISTTFSSVSITFSFMVITQVGLTHMFVPFFFTVCIAGLIAAIVVPRLPPLCNIKNLYIDPSKEQNCLEKGPASCNSRFVNVKQLFKNGSELRDFQNLFIVNLANVLTTILAVLPVILIVGTVALILAKYTNVFYFLGKPFVFFLELLKIPEAAEASECIAVGFADMLLPTLLSTNIQSDLTRFFIASVSITQVVNLSETGAVLLASKIPINFLELFAIFILRTLVIIPVIALMAHLFFN